MNHCEVCQNPDLCEQGQTTCDLSGEFHAPVPPEVANQLLARIRELNEKVRAHDQK